MDSTEVRRIKPNESFQLVLQSRGGIGLQLSYRVDNEGVVDVFRMEADTSAPVSPGSSMPVTYRITGVQKGKVSITFYETQPWNKSFKEIVQKAIQVEVTD
jgi:hypothetical protein